MLLVGSWQGAISVCHTDLDRLHVITRVVRDSRRLDLSAELINSSKSPSVLWREGKATFSSAGPDTDNGPCSTRQLKSEKV